MKSAAVLLDKQSFIALLRKGKYEKYLEKVVKDVVRYKSIIAIFVNVMN